MDGIPLLTLLVPERDDLQWILGLWVPEEASPGWRWGEGGTDLAARALLQVPEEGPGAAALPHGLQPLFVCGCGDENDTVLAARVWVEGSTVHWADLAWVVRDWSEQEATHPGPDHGWFLDREGLESLALTFDREAYLRWMSDSLNAELVQRAERDRVLKARDAGVGPTDTATASWWLDGTGRARRRELRIRLRRLFEVVPSTWTQAQEGGAARALAEADPLRLRELGLVASEVWGTMVADLSAALPFEELCERPGFWLGRYFGSIWDRPADPNGVQAAAQLIAGDAE